MIYYLFFILSLFVLLDIIFSFDPKEYSAEIAWFAPFLSGGGYCSEATAFALGLKKINYTNFEIYQHGDSINNDYLKDFEKSSISKHLKRLPFYQFDSSKRKYPMISVCHSEPGAWYVPMPKYHTSQCPYVNPNQNGKHYMVGRTMFETDTIPSGWKERLDYMDEIWVPTNFSKEIFLQNGINNKKLFVLEEGVDTDFFSPKENKTMALKELQKVPSWKKAIKNIETDLVNLHIFLFVGKFEARKGLDLLLEAYMTEFLMGESVLLIILTSAYHSSSEFQSEIKKVVKSKNLDSQTNNPPYIVLSGLPQDSMPAIYSLADILVIPSKGEGFGRPHVEAMACSTPIIATNWSGPLSFLNEKNGYPLAIENNLVDTP